MHLAYIWIVFYLSAKNYRNLWKFDKVLTKINLLSFFWDTVYIQQKYLNFTAISLSFHIYSTTLYLIIWHHNTDFQVDLMGQYNNEHNL